MMLQISVCCVFCFVFSVWCVLCCSVLVFDKWFNQLTTHVGSIKVQYSVGNNIYDTHVGSIKVKCSVVKKFYDSHVGSIKV